MFGLGKKKQRLSFNDPRNLIGKIAIVSMTIKPYIKGQIEICGTWYSAICEENNLILNRDELVEITNIEGNTVSVKPIVKSF
jgi:membrane protein implicated in regulation of membrane protease activity